MKKVQITFMLLLAALLTSPVVTFAWGWNPPPPDCNDVPLDGGLSLLVAAGAGYGIKKVAEKRKKNQEEKSK